MSKPTSRDEKGRFAASSDEGVRDDYPMRATNHVTGAREDVILMDPHHLATHEALTIDSMIELRTDLRRALSQFNRVEQRVILAVLVQGQSVETATARRKRTTAWWSNWLYGEAIPKLRESLADYQEVCTRDIRNDSGKIYGAELFKQVVLQ